MQNLRAFFNLDKAERHFQDRKLPNLLWLLVQIQCLFSNLSRQQKDYSAHCRLAIKNYDGIRSISVWESLPVSPVKGYSGITIVIADIQKLALVTRESKPTQVYLKCAIREGHDVSRVPYIQGPDIII
ncbi:hypothetical protein PHYBLDRAFT_72386 [Phycomyces blakesleeanus NRRL 1555(-)]|uniref:Uncharacterized protein n=1 Tax=Phycomyces blakesleeanus (strain ATCC 8743b / DSM 1359 / FGSC 10004 / NBRC 33097 / NRRL 1555) TaxID=763407 RepID=A0A167JCB5_PHYB8|nr:hypothetical protein PHYBLDRAFT_72386 [Phycomyces blakesleeanus NRRL 1555(-)]OAD65699.1 hypothetical protein PHYBLDRAFT_72386 [Phycomyces blakesleeanus NRRL 1555(-)]|eukprot:XP_018283739.1 hypothetical protein PHYBLDRAFT_72386 [Phycomyces blakesleeanus NRRL 1555(-)]